MGSSKKHKEKDRSKDHKRKKRHRSRSRSRSSKERKRRHRDSDDERTHRERDRDRDYQSNVDSTNEHRPSQDTQTKTESESASFEKEQLSLSIEETNKLRAKLGLKPLEVGGAKDGSSKSGENQDVHVPAINIGEKKRTEKLREKMDTTKAKREISNKLRVIKGLGESDSEDESASAWVQKSRQVQKEKEMAEKRAKLLEEMDEEFGVGSLVEQVFQGPKQKNYSSRDLSGLKVEHGMEKFREGSNIVLTLKDKGVLDEDKEDVLINVNIIDDEKAEKNVENKKKKPDYKPYDEPQFDEYGMLKSKEVLDKYDEEIFGQKRESFVLGSGGKYDAEHERNMEKIRQQLRQQGQTLDGPGLTIASEYLTPEEMNTKFKKVKKKVRKIRKKELLKADDLVPLSDQTAEPSDYGSRVRGRGLAITKMEEEEEGGGGDKLPPVDDACFYTGITVKEEPQEPVPVKMPLKAAADDDDLVGPDEDLSSVTVEEEVVQQELQTMLHKTRRLMQRNEKKIEAQKVIENLIKKEDISLSDEISLPAPANTSQAQGSNKIVLNSTSEFCRSLGEIPTYGLAGNREEEREEIMDLELELMEQRRQELEQEEQASGWNEVDIDTNPVNITGEEKSVLEEEPIVTESVGAALKLAMKKGYLENEPVKKPSSAPKHSYIQAQNYSIEDKRYDDLDEKYRKRDRYSGGMVTDFKDKDSYKPEIRLEYVDDSGRVLNPKEAFRQLSHRFHGKGSGKKKTEKRQKKVEEEQLMKQMSSTDTPLNTLSLLQDKQRSEKSPFVILSGNKTFSSLSQTLSKPR
ncbi:LOW QUALITY PROTEIN: U4/U6.U5 tri-snRNP-associated protein 1-like [Pomacea canaliculata]|uniref:LOW QUALITY PROTEIN: U4/U6.U5 tri-snRNP-associated protein 1-like n=1 Tax=Pomacea canaliculata TaxID=400727 RepID=UPI000D73165A|nr:LOW QUALITY PROTEIN: U4/U6.U5 tri-snRNP-associated protein 1-like [Pomacea canaliculata]